MTAKITVMRLGKHDEGPNGGTLTTAYGYIGLGEMGSAMAERLLSTDSTTHVFDLDAAAVQAAVDLGAVAAESATEVAARADVVSICVPAANHVESVMNGPAGIAASARTDLTILIHSTVEPEAVKAQHGAAQAWGGRVFDACVAGGAENARAGTLAMLVGGFADMPPEARALLDVYGSVVIDGGPVGAGAALKIGVNVMTYLQQAAARISFALMEANGADPAGLVDAWRHTNQLGELTERYLALLSLRDDDIRGDLRAYLETVASITEKDLRLAQGLGSVGPELDKVLETMADAAPSLMRVTAPGDA